MGENFRSELTLKEKALESILPDKNFTEEEFQNFMYRVTDIGEFNQSRFKNWLCFVYFRNNLDVCYLN